VYSSLQELEEALRASGYNADSIAMTTVYLAARLQKPLLLEGPAGAVGILVLSKILFGGFRGRPGPHMYWRRRMMERWEQMTPEEREKFRQGMRGGCGSFGSAAAGPKA